MEDTYNFSDFRAIQQHVSSQFECGDMSCYCDNVEGEVSNDLRTFLQDNGYKYGEDISTELVPCVFDLSKKYENEEEESE